MGFTIVLILLGEGSCLGRGMVVRNLGCLDGGGVMVFSFFIGSLWCVGFFFLVSIILVFWGIRWRRLYGRKGVFLR